MKKLVTLLLLVIAVLVLTPHTFWEDTNNLGDDYYYLPKYESIDIGYPNGKAVIYRSSQKNLFKEIKVEGDIISVSHNKDFIFAVTQPAPTNRKKNEGTQELFVVHKSLGKVSGPFPVDSPYKLKTSNQLVESTETSSATH